MLAHFIDSKSFQCGYFQDRKSFFEEYLLEDISENEFEYLLAHGMRHFGDYYFRPRCRACHECIPIRLRTEDFQMNRSQKRALKSCESVQIKVGVPRYSPEKFAIYLQHKKRFNPLQDDVEDEQNFRLSFYVHTPFGIEFEYYRNGKLIGAALADVTRKSFSAIYTFYVQSDIRQSLGTFSILKQIEFAKQRKIKFFYLGYFIEKNKSLAYKANYQPNEVYVEQEWRPFLNAKGEILLPPDKLRWENTDSLVKAVGPRESPSAPPESRLNYSEIDQV
jgi:arginine-tRNA-protein transferase